MPRTPQCAKQALWPQQLQPLSALLQCQGQGQGQGQKQGQGQAERVGRGR